MTNFNSILFIKQIEYLSICHQQGDNYDGITITA